MDPQPNPRSHRILVALLVLIVLVLLVATRVQRSKPDLSPWHTVRFENEFQASDARGGFSWEDYLALEEQLYIELQEKVIRNPESRAEPSWNRFAEGGFNNPAGFPRNWNRSFELEAEAAAGGVLVIHGLTDSPYSLRRTAEVFNRGGYHVVGLRLPGHGTAPSGLKSAEVEDWRAAVRVAATHLQKIVGASGELIVAGYSNGGALALDYALESLGNDDLRTPDQIILYSPAIGITRAAALARAHRVLSFMPWFNKLGWSGIEPENDPFKYNSFPTDAGYQTHVLTRSVRARLAAYEIEEAHGPFPPVLTFMSLADATVFVETVVNGLYDQLIRPENELVIFDINRQAKMKDFFRTDPAHRLQSLMDRPTTPYRLTVISNIDETTDGLEEWSRAAGETEAEIRYLDLEWPRGYFSLSHVAVPFPADDPIYGSHPNPEAVYGVRLGTLEPRGERGLLVVSTDQFLRLRSNPFFPYIEERLIEKEIAQ